MESKAPEGWLRLAEAAELAKVSEKTVRNWAESRRIGKRKLKGMALYSRRDIELMGEKQTEMALVQQGPPVLAQLIARASEAAAPALMPAMASGVLSAAHLPLWLNYEQAGLFSGLGLARLHELVKDSKIRTERGPHGATVLSRADLERLAT